MAFGNPICGYPLRKGARIFARVDLMLALLFIMSRLSELDLHQFKHEAEKAFNKFQFYNLDNDAGLIKMGNDVHWHTLNYTGELVVANFVGVAWLLLEIWLYRTLIGACDKGKANGCKNWIWGRSAIMLIETAALVLILYNEGEFKGMDWAGLCTNVFRLYGIWIVYELKNELNINGNALQNVLN